jgi:hypothetical protein
MNFKGKEVLAHLMKQRFNGKFQWFWINPITGSIISQRFDTQDAADAWFNTLADSHNESYDFMNRLTNGKIYKVKAVVDFTAILSSTKICPFDVEQEGNTLSANILGLDMYDARLRFREYFDVLEWIEND